MSEGVREENERLLVALEQATREIELVEKMGRVAERRSRRGGGYFGILVGTDEHALEYQRLDAEREKLRKTREAKMRVLRGEGER